MKGLRLFGVAGCVLWFLGAGAALAQDETKVVEPAAKPAGRARSTLVISSTSGSLLSACT